MKHRAKYSYSVAGIQMPIDNNYTENNSIKSTTVTDYCGNYIYSGGNLQILNPEGYYDFDYGYVYLLKDHLGSTTVALQFAANSSRANVIQKTQYYASGLEMYIPNGTVSGPNPYLYNGKEMDRMHGLNIMVHDGMIRRL
ncbi:MAG: hypothetical protein Q8909_08910 [Bacteroidota bacterium]|nr:hypothetical protein [Bacteroidota bacterium]